MVAAGAGVVGGVGAFFGRVWVAATVVVVAVVAAVVVTVVAVAVGVGVGVECMRAYGPVTYVDLGEVDLHEQMVHLQTNRETDRQTDRQTDKRTDK